MRSLEFTVPSLVDTLFHVEEQSDGSLLFTVSIDTGSGSTGDLRAVFIDFFDDTLLDPNLLTVSGSDVTDTRIKAASVDTVGQDANVKGTAANSYGKYDIGIEIGTMGISGDDIQETSFKIAYAGGDLDINQINWQDFAVRATSVGKADGPRSDSLKAGITATAAPDALDDAITVAEDDVLTATGAGLDYPNLLTNDMLAWVDPDDVYVIETVAGDAANVGAAISVTSEGGVATEVTINADGTIDFDPTVDFNGLAVGEQDRIIVDYSIYDSNGGRDSAQAIITIAGRNDAPVSLDDAYATDEDIALNVAVAAGVLTNDNDSDGDQLSAVLVSGPVHGSLTLNADGSFDYTPDTNFNGADSFTYKANDGAVDGNEATVGITVNPVNDAAVISGATVGAVSEDGVLVAIGTLAIADADDGESFFHAVAPASLTGTYGDFTFNEANGHWGYTLRNADGDVQALDTGETVYDTLTVTSLDGSASQDITVSIAGMDETASVLSSHARGIANGVQYQTENLIEVGPFSTKFFGTYGVRGASAFDLDGETFSTATLTFSEGTDGGVVYYSPTGANTALLNGTISIWAYREFDAIVQLNDFNPVLLELVGSIDTSDISPLEGFSFDVTAVVQDAIDTGIDIGFLFTWAGTGGAPWHFTAPELNFA